MWNGSPLDSNYPRYSGKEILLSKVCHRGTRGWKRGVENSVSFVQVMLLLLGRRVLEKPCTLITQNVKDVYLLG